MAPRNDEIVGLVLEVHGPPQGRHAFLRLPVHGPSGETGDEFDISLPVSTLRVATVV
jgi:hypothetical protein